MAEGIDHAAQAPAILFLHRDDLLAPAATARANIASGSGTVKIIRTVPPPSDSGLKLPCSGDSSASQNSAPSIAQPSHHRTAWVFHSKDLDRPECRLVELHRSRAIPNRQQGCDRTSNGSPRKCVCAHQCFPAQPYRQKQPTTVSRPGNGLSILTRRAAKTSFYVAAVTPDLIAPQFICTD